MLSEEAQRAAWIFHQTPGWRWRRKLCLNERTQQCQSGPTTKAWFHDRCNRVDSDACRGSNVTTRVRHRQSTCEKQCQKSERNACWRGNVETRAWHRLGTCRKHCQSCMERVARAGGTARTRSTREWTALFQRTWQTTELQRQETCGQHRLGTRRWQLQRVRVAPPGSIVWTSAGSTARKRHLDECGEPH